MRGSVRLISYSESDSDACDVSWRFHTYAGLYQPSESLAASGRTGHRGQSAFHRTSGKLAPWPACRPRLLPLNRVSGADEADSIRIIRPIRGYAFEIPIS